MAPLNFADQPMALVRELRRGGLDIRHLNYSADGRHPLGYELDWAVKVSDLDTSTQLEVLQQCLEQDFDIYHFWQRSLVFNRQLDGLSGIDLPILKAQGATIFHRFTGLDLRMSQQDLAFNPFSPFRFGFENPFDESRQQEYLEFLNSYVDRFFVQDPELLQFMPDATVLPRGLALDEWQFVGVERTDKPLIVHAPTNPAVKGSSMIVAALETLSREKTGFEYKILEGVSHEEARQWYEKADIVIDQILIGATGVLTLEAWALGKPCVTYLREDLFTPFYGTSTLPVANANPDTIESTLRKLITDYDWREQLSAQGRETVEKYHDIREIARDYREIVGQHIAAPRTTGKSSNVPEFLSSGIRLQGSRTPARAFGGENAVRGNAVATFFARVIRCQEWLFDHLISWQIRLVRLILHLKTKATRDSRG